MDILELKNSIITEIRNLLEGLNRKYEKVEWINKFENMLTWVYQSKKQKKKKRLEKNEQNAEAMVYIWAKIHIM